MSNDSGNEWIDFSPDLKGANKKAFLEITERLIESYAEYGFDNVGVVLDSALSSRLKGSSENTVRAKLAVSLAADLIRQEWTFERCGNGFKCRRHMDAKDLDKQRSMRRSQLSLKRDSQLLEGATRKFIRDMEKPVATPKGRFSIFDLMCDGSELAGRIECALESGSKTPVSPYLQIASGDEFCSETGLKLLNIWRYFRHSWSNSYESIPGRSMCILVRDALGPNHPVIGIIALGSAASRLGCRDSFIGWTNDAVTNEIISSPTSSWCKWIIDQLNELDKETYSEDLQIDGLMASSGFLNCTLDDVYALKEESKNARERHQQNPSSDAEDECPLIRAKSDLYRSKRCLRLADLIQCSIVLNAKEGVNGVKSAIKNNSDSSAVKRSLGLLVKYARSNKVGTEIADIVVCGAVQPYNDILGGKLIAMLAASPDIVKLYKERYSNPSKIASSNAGFSLVKPANLALLTTTSLYGIRPSQYDRASYPCDVVGGDSGVVRYKFLERTSGYGTSHISETTFNIIHELFNKISDPTKVSRVNNVFGEGANPKFRAIQEGISEIGLDSEAFLNHGQSKCVYCVELTSNTRDYLIGKAKKPKYPFRFRKGGYAQDISNHWFERWMKKRVGSEVLDRIRTQSKALPVRHGARVVLPNNDTQEIPLFADLQDV